MKLFGRQIETERVTIEPRTDGTFGPCYFCGATVSRGSDVAVLVVERVDPAGDPIHGVCHDSCVERARGA